MLSGSSFAPIKPKQLGATAWLSLDVRGAMEGQLSPDVHMAGKQLSLQPEQLSWHFAHQHHPLYLLPAPRLAPGGDWSSHWLLQEGRPVQGKFVSNRAYM